MKKIAIINCGDNGSTGKICVSLMQHLKAKGYEVLFAAHNIKKSILEDHHVFQIRESKVNFLISKVLCRIDGSDGFRNKYATKKLLKKLDEFNPDIVHLHNLHGHYMNFKLLFDYIFEKKIKVVWTLHDCWSFTGRCPYFDISKCDQWKESCIKCPRTTLHDYPASYLLNRPKFYFDKKINAILSIKNNLTLVTPSKWLQCLLAKSMLHECNSVVIRNGIKSSTLNYSSLVSDLGIDTNKILLICVAYPFSKSKGINHVIKLSKVLDYSKYELIVVGLKEKQRGFFCDKIKSTGYINDPGTMSFLFGFSDWFINPTLEDNFPTVNIESLMAGTPVITFDTGGSPEIISEKTGIIVERDNFDKLLYSVEQIDKKTDAMKNECVKRSMQFVEEKMCTNYLDLFESILNTK